MSMVNPATHIWKFDGTPVERNQVKDFPKPQTCHRCQKQVVTLHVRDQVIFGSGFMPTTMCGDCAWDWDHMDL